MLFPRLRGILSLQHLSTCKWFVRASSFSYVIVKKWLKRAVLIMLISVGNMQAESKNTMNVVHQLKVRKTGSFIY